MQIRETMDTEKYKVKRYLVRKEQQGLVELMQWLSRNSDLNIIEQIWDHLDREKNEKQPKSVKEFSTILQNV